MASPSDCPRCAAVAKGSRVRLTEESAQLLEALLRSQRRISVRERRRAINRDDATARAEAERQLKLIDFVIEEVESAQFENEWHSVSGQLYD